MAVRSPDNRDGLAGGTLADELILVFQRLAGGDLTARLPRNFKRDREDAIAFLVGVFAEQLEERVQSRQRMLLDTVIESMIDGVLLTDATGRIRRANGAMSTLVGREPHELVGLHVSELLIAEEHEVATNFTDQVTRGLFKNRETLFRARDGSALTMAVNGSPHRDVDGTLIGIVLVARDDRELQSARAHLDLSDRLATMGTLAAGVAHEINNPLAFISANVDFALEELGRVTGGGELPRAKLREIVRALRSCRTGAGRVRQIVQELRGFTRAAPDAVATVDLHAVLDSALAFAANEIRHHARLVKDYGSPPPVLANEGRLVQAFLNLLQNAAQSIPIGSADQNEIRIVTGAGAEGVFVEVRDTGCGIPEENLSRVFDLFYTTKPVGVGIGLGLSIALRLIRKAGGRLEVESKIGVGSVFRVVLPTAPPTKGAARVPRATARRRRSAR